MCFIFLLCNPHRTIKNTITITHNHVPNVSISIIVPKYFNERDTSKLLINLAIPSLNKNGSNRILAKPAKYANKKSGIGVIPPMKIAQRPYHFIKTSPFCTSSFLANPFNTLLPKK